MKFYLNIITGILLLASLAQPGLAAADGQAAEGRAVADISGTVPFFYYDEIHQAAPFYAELLGLTRPRWLHH